MIKRICFTAMAVMLIAGIGYAGTVTPLYDGTGVSQTVVGAFTFSDMQTQTLENGETIDNEVDAQVRVTFDDDAVILGTEKVESDNPAASIAAGDEFQKSYSAYNDVTQKTIYAYSVVDITDETDGTEDGSRMEWVMVNGTLTLITTINATGLDVVGDVSGTTIGGITEANLVDKTASETISGVYTYSAEPLFGTDWVVTGPDATTGLMIQAASITSTSSTLQTNTFATAFQSAPVCTVSYTEDAGSAEAPWIVSVSASAIVVTTIADKNYSYIAVGAGR